MIKRLWHSPTFTSWGNKLAASARLFLVLPLLLTRFDDVQLAAWFLFGSILFFGSVVGAQTSLVLSRMVSVAFGGAKSLEGITSSRRPEVLGDVNWPLLYRLYGSMGFIDVLNGTLSCLIGLGLGWFSLSAVTRDYQGGAEIWTAFIIFIVGQLIVQSFRRYSVVLRGLNQVALSNRWEALFALLSAVSGSVTLLAGGSMVHLAVVMQFFLVLGVVRQWLLLMYVVEPRFREVSIWRLDRQIALWVWQPLWRSFIRAIANRGAARVGAVVLARNTDPAVLSSILLALRLLDTLEDFAVTPMSSHVPRFGRLLAQGDLEQFRRSVMRALRISCWLQCVGVVAIGFCVYVGLELIGSSTKFLLPAAFFGLAIPQLLASQIRQNLMISVIGNNIIAVWRLMCAAVVSAALAILLIPYFPLCGFVFSAYIPLIIILNRYPLVCGCDLLGVKVMSFVRSTLATPYLIVGLVGLLSLFVRWDLWGVWLAHSLKALW